MVGAADYTCTNDTKLEILALVKKETERRSAMLKQPPKKKSTMRQGEVRVAVCADPAGQTWTPAR